MSFNPDLEKLRKELDLDYDTIRKYLPRIKWRREMKKALRGDFDEKYPEDPMTMFLASGRQYFDKDVLIARKRELIGFKPYQTMSNGEAKIFWPRIPGRRYIIGADPATGRQIEGIEMDTDFCAAVVLDMETEEEMAAFRARVTPQDLAYDLADLGHYFNDAPIAVERTGDGATTILTLTGECKYPSIVKFKEWHRRVMRGTGKNNSNQGVRGIEFEGFPTTSRTRPHALNLVNEWLTYYPEKCWDEQFLNEALVFVRDERGIPAGANGTHDDTVAARWIAHGSRAHILGYWNPGEGKRASYVSSERLEASA
jgi:hypothetical protein